MIKIDMLVWVAHLKGHCYKMEYVCHAQQEVLITLRPIHANLTAYLINTLINLKISVSVLTVNHISMASIALIVMLPNIMMQQLIHANIVHWVLHGIKMQIYVCDSYRRVKIKYNKFMESIVQRAFYCLKFKYQLRN